MSWAASPSRSTAAPTLEAESSRLGWTATYLAVPRVLSAGTGWLRDPRTAARAIGAGLRLIHDTLPVDDCPFGPPSWVTDEPDVDRKVVCHGDACAPNTLIDDVGRPCGRRPLGRPRGRRLVADVQLPWRLA